MSMIETIVSRAMNDASFADAIMANPEQALREYALSADELAQFKSMSQADFGAFAAASPEERQTFCLGCNWGPPLTNHNQSALKVISS